MEKFRILIAVPTYENILPDTMKSIYDLDKGGHDVTFDFIRGYDATRARNEIARRTLGEKYDYALMVDSDEILPKDALINLLETERSEPAGCMAVGYCLARPKGGSNTSGRTTAFRFGGRHYQKEDAITADEMRKLRDEGVTKVSIRGTGLGCALINRSVFRRMEFPYFAWKEKENGRHLSEDLYFSEKFREIDAPIYVDPRVACGHWMRHIEYI